jgi:hypothetical protein
MHRIVHGFLSSSEAARLASQFKIYAQATRARGDSRCPTSQNIYNWPPFLQILCDQSPEVGRLIGEPVLPTYCYARIYPRGAELTPHTDRPACEISLTVHLGGDKPWPIWVMEPDGLPEAVILAPGDALLYEGCKVTHWRDPYEGESYAQVFMHYVRSAGTHRAYFFDQRYSSINQGETPLTNDQLRTQLSTLIEAYGTARATGNELLVQGAAATLIEFLEGVEMRKIEAEETDGGEG